MASAEVSMADLLQLVPNRYRLVQAVAKRACQLTEGATALVECDSSNPLTIAVQEIAAGAISLEDVPEEEEAAEQEEKSDE
jgi:DNA-directed RNA polymerase subunit omega